MSRGPVPRSLLPDNAAITPDGRLSIGGCDVIDLTEQYGTPLFVYDDLHLAKACEEAVAAFPDGVAYASKAFLCRAMVRLAIEAGMDIDVATGGELHVALAAGAPASRLVLHGNNKSDAELAMAVDHGVGRIVVDSFDELARLDRHARDAAAPPNILVRLNPGVEAHTHEYLQTGAIDSKFGFPVEDGQAERAIDMVRRSRSMRFNGIHAHIGSQVFDTTSFASAMGVLAPVVAAADAPELSIGGGLGVAYVEGEDAPSITEWAAAIHGAARRHGIRSRITAEPGRAIVARAAVTAYTVGTIKQIPGVREYVAVDGGMSDNPRPVLYGSGYEAFLARAADAVRTRGVRVVGKHCESGDVIVRDAWLPLDLRVGDVLCTPVTGAYGHAMGSNYNKVLRPPVVFVANGASRLVIERETYSDLLARDVG